MDGKPTKMKTFASFTAWKDDQTEANQKIINALQKIIKDIAPQFTTTVKWGQGCWTDGDTPRIYIHGEDDHVQLGFYSGSSLEDPQEILMGNGKYVRFVKIHRTEDIDATALTALITQVT